MSHNIKNLYDSLLDSADYFHILKKSNPKIVDGTPTCDELYISMIYQLIIENPNLIEDKDKLFNILIRFTKELIIDDIPLEYENVDDYILNVWLNSNDEVSSDYYHSNGAYCLFGIQRIQLKEMLRMLKSM